jgi:hypothetical protein
MVWDYRTVNLIFCVLVRMLTARSRLWEQVYPVSQRLKLAKGIIEALTQPMVMHIRCHSRLAYASQ